MGLLYETRLARRTGEAVAQSPRLSAAVVSPTDGLVSPQVASE